MATKKKATSKTTNKGTKQYTKEQYQLDKMKDQLDTIETKTFAIDDTLSNTSGIIFMLMVTMIGVITLLFKLRDYKDNHSDIMNHLYSEGANVGIVVDKLYGVENTLYKINGDTETIKNGLYEYNNNLEDCEEINNGTQVICNIKQNENCFRDKFYNLICDY